jgi:hypothetical protein
MQTRQPGRREKSGGSKRIKNNETGATELKMQISAGSMLTMMSGRGRDGIEHKWGVDDGYLGAGSDTAQCSEAAKQWSGWRDSHSQK